MVAGEIYNFVANEDLLKDHFPHKFMDQVNGNPHVSYDIPEDVKQLLIAAVMEMRSTFIVSIKEVMNEDKERIFIGKTNSNPPVEEQLTEYWIMSNFFKNVCHGHISMIPSIRRRAWETVLSMFQMG